MRPSATGPTNRPACNAFTLIELLAVVTIIGLLATFASVGINGILGSQKMATSVGMLRHDMGWASIESSKRNLPVYLRFYKFENEDAGEEGAQFHAYQFLVVDSLNSEMKPIGSVERLPEGIILHPDSTYSTLLTLGEKAPSSNEDDDITDPELDLPPYTYVEFQFRPDGSTDLPADKQWSLTLIASSYIASGQTDLPKSYRSIVINPFTSATRSY